MQQRTTGSSAIELILVIGLMVLLWQVLSQVLQTASLVPYIVVSLFGILTFVVKSRFKDK